MRITTMSAALAATLALAACETRLVDPEADGLDDAGPVAVDAAAFEPTVSVAREAGMAAADLEALLLLNAARLAARNGSPYFAITERELAREVEPVYASPTLYGPEFGVFDDYRYPYYNSGWGASVMPVGPIGPLSAGGGVAPAAAEVATQEAVATVQLLDERAAGRGDVYETDRVLARLEPLLEE